MKVVAPVLILAIALLLWPDPFARLIWRRRVVVLDTDGSPILPAGCDARYAARFCKLAGKPSGISPAAVTLGRTVLVADHLTPERLIEVLKHERGHCLQKMNDGVWYLPKYILGFLKHGYHAHPYEVEANAQEDE